VLLGQAALARRAALDEQLRDELELLGAAAPSTVVCTPVRSSAADECVSELTWSRSPSGSAASTSSILGARVQSCGSRSMTSSSIPSVCSLP
jgi:hypothetical protein